MFVTPAVSSFEVKDASQTYGGVKIVGAAPHTHTQTFMSIYGNTGIIQMCFGWTTQARLFPVITSP